ncbi:NPCBM/NEW2 domain-containing protein [Amycolatopsis sp. YIM 10]|uniref:NPCBM/NEW2 domain-containing protein n=1 Tax=Amycolatopsis sp. YIM 10 TaxID=2653857 RepID=UPI0012A97BE2|nr:NPCBM/NEW2 domain-containing protein [Amycolatopsis sp. YIM 10]QFU88148.1 Alpha-galactosidase A precursor [Amycolatopsis sp. YIM 10]
MSAERRRTPARGWVLAASLALCATAFAQPASGAEPTPAPPAGDGLALTPPMGFNNWNTTHCEADFNETLVRDIADIFVSHGLKEAGYTYVNLDDCWALPERAPNGDLVPDPVRFPHGIKAVADYVHSKGLKFGIYSSAGTKTCNEAGFPGALGHEQQDANLFASWGVDYLKYDNCNNQGVNAIERYTKMRDALRATGRPIVFSICEWGTNQPWEWGKGVGHLWRTTIDINDSWASMLSILKLNMVRADHAGPGHWNDPDMLEVGNGGMTATEYRSHFSLWSMMAAPLLIGADLRKVTPETFEILGNRDVIAVDQDPLGVQGRPIRSAGGLHVFVKPLAGGDRAVALFNENDTPARIETNAAELGLPQASGYQLRDLWAHTDAHTAGTISAMVPAHGTAMYRIGADRHWFQYPPALDAAAEVELSYASALPVVAPGTPAAYTTTLGNSGGAPVNSVRAKLLTPPTWSVRATSDPTTTTLRENERFRTTWEVSAPPGTPPGRYPVSASFDYVNPQTGAPATLTHTSEAVVPEVPQTGTRYLSDVPWLRSYNGWGPVEIDRANGGRLAGDGGPLTLRGVTYAKGLGTHALSSVEYFTGGACSEVRALVGVDDGRAGSVTFEVWTDGERAYDSGPLTRTDPAKELVADISGAKAVRLVATDAGDGVQNDHADWAELTLTC